MAVDWRAAGADQALVAAAMRGLRRVRTEEEGQAAYNDVLDAIGHNHSGWLYDAAGPAAPILVRIAQDAEGWARRTALEILIDCLAWARPEQRYTDADGHIATVQDALYRAVASVAADLQTWAADRDALAPLSKSASDLLEALHEEKPLQPGDR